MARYDYDPITPEDTASVVATNMPLDIRTRERDSQSSIPNREKHGSVVDRSIPLVTDSSAATTRKLATQRKTSSASAVFKIYLDSLLTLTALLFIVYAILVKRNDGRPITTEPVPSLEAASRYGPTVFPILYAAITANLLRATAAWRLERGISVLNLEFLLRSRTVFSAVTAPAVLGTVNLVSPFLILLWAFSPIGGQAALRVVTFRPSNDSQPWTGRYAEFNGPLGYLNTASEAGPEILPQAAGVFAAALASPEEIKVASQDAFGNIRIPMIEQFLASNATPDSEGWYGIENDTNIEYSSLMGLPLRYVDGFNQPFNRTFSLEATYMYTNCTMSHTKHTTSAYTKWTSRLMNTESQGPNTYHNGRTMMLVTDDARDANTKTPRPLNFTSVTYDYMTNATCIVTSTFVEVGVKCHLSDCGPARVRAVPEPGNVTIFTALDGLGPDLKLEFGLQGPGFLSTFVNSTKNPWFEDWATSPSSTPLEYFFTHPISPYAVTYNSRTNWIGEDVWHVNESIFPTRFSQLLNTFWIINIGPFAVTGNLTCRELGEGYEMAGDMTDPYCRTTNGTMIPDVLVLRADNAWLAVLLLASLIMFFSSIIATIFGSLRRGPEVLDFTTSMMRYSPYTGISEGHSSMEDGADQVSRLKDATVCLGDIRPEQELGYVTLGMRNKVLPLSKQATTRRYE